MTAVIETTDLGKRYGRRTWAVRDCSLTVPAGRVVGLVGANGAGKTTLLHMLVGLLAPTVGQVTMLGEPPAAGPSQLARVGFVAQSVPLYPSLSIDDHLRLGRHLNPRWDVGMARDRIERLGLDRGQAAGMLSGGQRAQLALTLAIAKCPDVLLLDEPVASLDPLARREFLQTLMEGVAERDLTVVLSSHLLGDVERVCDHLVVMARGHVRIAGEVSELLETHRWLTGPRRAPDQVPRDQQVISQSHTDRQTTLLVRTAGPILDPAWTVSEPGLEELVLAYMANQTNPVGPSRSGGTANGLKVVR